MKNLRMFIFGFALAALLFAGNGLHAQESSAKLPADTAGYVTKASTQIKSLDAIYVTAKDYFYLKKNASDVAAARKNLNTLREEINASHPPLALNGFHSQLLFALGKCDNLLISAEGTKEVKSISVFEGGIYISLRDTCSVQLQAAKLRLIDYTVPYGLNPLQ